MEKKTILKIKKYLAVNKISITSLAKKLNTPQPTLHRTLCADDIKLGTLFNIEKALGLESGYFIKEKVVKQLSEEQYVKKLELRFIKDVSNHINNGNEMLYLKHSELLIYMFNKQAFEAYQKHKETINANKS